MSLLHLSINAKELWNSHSTIKGILTGNIFGNALVNHGLKQWPAYHSLKEKVASLALHHLTPHFGLVSPGITQKILENTLDKKQISLIGNLLKNKIAEKSRSELYSFACKGMGVVRKATMGYLFGFGTTNAQEASPPKETSSGSGMKELITYVYANYSREKAYQLTALLMKGEFAEFTQIVLTSSLHPVCEKGVKSGLSSLVKISVSEGMDFVAKFTLSTVIQTLFYKTLVSSLFQQTTSQLFYQHKFDASFTCFPGEDPTTNICTILFFSAAFHLTQLGYVFIQNTLSKDENTEIDKKIVKELILKHARGPIENKLKESPLFKYLDDTVDQSSIDSFIKKLTEEGIEIYWEDLKQKELFGLPIVK